MLVAAATLGSVAFAHWQSAARPADLDRLGWVDLTVVYCTLCGPVIAYKSGAGGRRFTFGTRRLDNRQLKGCARLSKLPP